MTDINDLVDAFKREVAPLGGFDAQYPNVSDPAIAAALMDAFAEAQLDGFFGRHVLDVEGETVTPDLSVAGAALVVLYAGMRNAKHALNQQAASSGATYKAGPVTYQTTSAATVLKAQFDALNARRLELIENARRGGGSPVFSLDMYESRANQHNFYGGFLAGEYGGSTVMLGLG